MAGQNRENFRFMKQIDVNSFVSLCPAVGGSEKIQKIDNLFGTFEQSFTQPLI